jgi:hypothetical protein
MAIPTNNLRLFLTFVDDLKQVRVLAVTNRIGGSQLAFMGAVEGKDQLQQLLEAAGINHYIVSSGDILGVSFKSTAYEKTPKQIIDALDKEFQKGHDLHMKILDGKILSDEERSFTVRNSLHVGSSAVNTEDGLKRVQDWFKTKGRKS